MFALGAVSPWLTMLDPNKFNAYVDGVQNLPITTVAACHTPVIEGDYIAKAFNRVREFPTLAPPDLPNQAALEAIVAALS
jgi:hypothetical protein